MARENRGWTSATWGWAVLHTGILILVLGGAATSISFAVLGRIGALPTPSNTKADIHSTMRFGMLWQQRVVDLATPLLNPAIAGAIMLLALFVLARMFVYLPRIWFFAFGPFVEKRKWLRYTSGILGALAMIAASATLVVVLTLGHLWLTTCFALLGLAGSVLFGSFLATQLRVRISVKSAGMDDVALVARVAALMNELGGAQPSGLEAPVGADITDLKSAVVTVPDGNPFIEAVKWVVTALFTSAPWHVLVGVSGDLVSVNVSRNLRSFAAVDISPDAIYRPAEVGQPVHSGRSKSTSASILNDYLLEFAAAAVITSLAREHPGFKGLSGERAADWISVGLQFVATSRFADDKETQRALLCESLNRDPTNLLAEVALQNLVYEKSEVGGERNAYLEWIEGKLFALRVRPERPYDLRKKMQPQTKPAWTVSERARARFRSDTTSIWLRRRLKRSGYVDIYRRLLYSYLVLSLNIRTGELIAGGGPDQHFLSKKLPARRAAQWACQSVRNDMPLSGTLRNRMRPNFALFYAAAELSDPPSPYLVWYQTAMATSSSSVAFNCAAVLADRWFVEPSGEVKDRWFRLLKERVRTATRNPAYQDKARTDPALARFEGQKWFEEFVGRSALPPVRATRRVHRIIAAFRRDTKRPDGRIWLT
jgi:hypothetical protein